MGHLPLAGVMSIGSLAVLNGDRRAVRRVVGAATAPPPPMPETAARYDAYGGAFHLATSGDLQLAATEDISMATDSV